MGWRSPQRPDMTETARTRKKISESADHGIGSAAEKIKTLSGGGSDMGEPKKKNSPAALRENPVNGIVVYGEGRNSSGRGQFRTFPDSGTLQDFLGADKRRHADQRNDVVATESGRQFSIQLCAEGPVGSDKCPKSAQKYSICLTQHRSPSETATLAVYIQFLC